MSVRRHHTQQYRSTGSLSDQRRVHTTTIRRHQSPLRIPSEALSTRNPALPERTKRTIAAISRPGQIGGNPRQAGGEGEAGQGTRAFSAVEVSQRPSEQW